MYQDSHNRLKEEMMNIEELKTKTEADISEYITKKSLSLRKDRERSYQYPVYCTGKNDWS